MVMPIVNVNYLAILVAAVASMLIGTIWYSSALFGKPWVKLMGGKAKKKPSAGTFLLSFISAFVMVYVLANFVGYLSVATISDALQLAFWLWLGFVATVSLNGVLWGSRPWKLYIIKTAHQFVSLFVMASIIALW